jgi:hypothetical protein
VFIVVIFPGGCIDGTLPGMNICKGNVDATFTGSALIECFLGEQKYKYTL